MKGFAKKVLLASAVFGVSASMTSFAGMWRVDNGQKWYQNEDGSYPQNGWTWIDGDYDGVSECFYFDANGYVLTNGVTPDGCEVNWMGEWVVDGEVQRKSRGAGSEPTYNTGSTDSWLSDDWADDGWNFLNWNYDPDWYLKDENLSEGDKAAYHYSAKYYQWDSKAEGMYDRVSEQYDRIAANPCQEAAQAEMTWVEIPVWRLKNGQKMPDTTKVQVMSSIADEVREVFTEIYNGPEQFPISSVGGFAWRGNGLGSNHSAGLSIDINPDANPQVAWDGTVLVGGKWEPGTNPYSIGRDSDVVKAFGKHGWGWGAAFGTKDYMHFDW